MVQVLHPGKFSRGTHGTWKTPGLKRNIIFHPPPFFGVPTVNLPGVKPPLKPLHQIPPRSTPAHPSGTCRRAWGFLVCLEIDSLPHEHPSPPKTNGWISKMMVWIKTLSHLGHYDLQKRTGFVRRPQLLHQKMTVEVVDKYLSECRNQNNFNLPLLMDKYVLEMPRPINCDMPSSLVDIQPGAVPYHRKKLKELHAGGAWWSSISLFFTAVWIVCTCMHPLVHSSPRCIDSVFCCPFRHYGLV